MESRADADEDWLLDRAEKLGFKPSANDVELFVEKVAVCVIDGGLDEKVARVVALQEVARRYR